MKGNFLFLVCTPCEQAGETEFGFKIAGRTQETCYEHVAPVTAFDTWLRKHRNCGGRTHPDHFQLGLMMVADHDQEKPVETAVKLALVK